MDKVIDSDLVSGVLLLDKPTGISSNHILQKIKRLLGVKKQDTGTLDPLATGMLPIAINEAAKFCQYLLDSDKTYVVTMRLGIVTDTGDCTGKVLTTQTVPSVSAIQFKKICDEFVGPSFQIPPMYSALKKEGVPLYRYARQGVEIERAPRAIDIHQISLEAFDGIQARLTVKCSKGTYIRVLVEDIGKKLGCGAHVTALRRLSAGPYVAEHMLTVDQITEQYHDRGSLFFLTQSIL